MRLNKRGIIAIIAIVLVMASYLVLDFVRGLSYYNRGSALAKKGEYERAILAFTKAVEIEPTFAEAYCNRGTVYAEKGEYDLAIADFSKAIDIEPEFAEAYCNRAIAYYYKGEYDKAWLDVHKAESLGAQVQPGFLKALREASRKERWIRKGQPTASANRRSKTRNLNLHILKNPLFT